jgi:hypothetical protein
MSGGLWTLDALEALATSCLVVWRGVWPVLQDNPYLRIENIISFFERVFCACSKNFEECTMNRALAVSQTLCFPHGVSLPDKSDNIDLINEIARGFCAGGIKRGAQSPHTRPKSQHPGTLAAALAWLCTVVLDSLRSLNSRCTVDARAACTRKLLCSCAHSLLSPSPHLHLHLHHRPFLSSRVGKENKTFV